MNRGRAREEMVFGVCACCHGQCRGWRGECVPRRGRQGPGWRGGRGVGDAPGSSTRETDSTRERSRGETDSTLAISPLSHEPPLPVLLGGVGSRGGGGAASPLLENVAGGDVAALSPARGCSGCARGTDGPAGGSAATATATTGGSAGGLARAPSEAATGELETSRLL